ncbi:DUF1697 domain-containing protein [Luteimonas sp. SMYT11W]|uniref:DUF1697 domain-containing protein n=1 Tax=Luteimonas flava TaxID=3115822 RepID=A0ABU7WGH8_9GAMM
MPRFVVLLRGVNVGKGNRVPMAAFKQLLESLGCTQVRTLLNSGNAVVTASVRATAKFAQTIADALSAQLGVSTPVIVKSAAELDRIVSESPMVPAESEHSRCLVIFAQAPEALRLLDDLQPLAVLPEQLVVTGDAGYLECPAGLLESKVAPALLGKSGRALTTRNWATVLKLQGLLDAE